MLLKQQQLTKLYGQYGLYIAQGHPLTSPPPYVIKGASVHSIGGVGWELALSLQGIVGRQAPETQLINHRWGKLLRYVARQQEGTRGGGSTDWGLFRLIIAFTPPVISQRVQHNATFFLPHLQVFK